MFLPLWSTSLNWLMLVLNLYSLQVLRTKALHKDHPELQLSPANATTNPGAVERTERHSWMEAFWHTRIRFGVSKPSPVCGPTMESICWHLIWGRQHKISPPFSSKLTPNVAWEQRFKTLLSLCLVLLAGKKIPPAASGTPTGCPVWTHWMRVPDLPHVWLPHRF